MCVSTKPMKKTPVAAMSSFSVIVERDARAPMTRPFVCPGLGRVVATSAGYRGAERDTAAAARAATSTAYAASARDAQAPASAGSSRPSTTSRNALSCLGTGGSPPWSVVSADRTPSAQCTSIRRLGCRRAPAHRVRDGRTVGQCRDDLGDLDETVRPDVGAAGGHLLVGQSGQPPRQVEVVGPEVEQHVGVPPSGRAALPPGGDADDRTEASARQLRVQRSHRRMEALDVPDHGTGRRRSRTAAATCAHCSGLIAKRLLDQRRDPGLGQRGRGAQVIRRGRGDDAGVDADGDQVGEPGDDGPAQSPVRLAVVGRADVLAAVQ